jgi:hypothetical protein
MLSSRCSIVRQQMLGEQKTMMLYPLHVIGQKLPVRVEIRTCLQAGLRRCAKLPDARVYEILLLRILQRSGKLGLLPDKPLKLFVESAVRGYVLFSRQLISGIPVYQPPSFLIEGADLAGNAHKLPSRAPVGHFGTVLDAAAKSLGIDHDLPGHLEDLAFKDMRADLRIAAALDLREVVPVLPCPPITAVHGTVIHGHPSRGSSHLVVPPRGRAPAAAHAALDKAAKKVAGSRLAIPLFVLAKPLLHLLE